ncbi:hypothetical protein BROUX41_001813 [Berkeleyomyces rouxiae]|uniref:uncharacterized protein n=1 Tax=Berkeleyomyces rouxiae TaxID=2035830 RepID=UPI003B7A20FF
MAAPVAGFSVETTATSSPNSPSPSHSVPGHSSSSSSRGVQHAVAGDLDNMKLDLLMLTFNCAKAAIDVGTFATHLYSALLERGQAAAPAQLPEMVVLSLQEVAPLPNAFIGGALLDLYLHRFEEALNLAALNAAVGTDTSSVGCAQAAAAASDTTCNINANSTSTPALPLHFETLPPDSDRPYSLIKSHNVGMTALMLFARSPAAVGPVQVAEVGFGAAGMGNKGAVGLRTVFSRAYDSSSESTELTFVAAHLAAMEENLAQRNANWLRIMRELTFADPAPVIQKHAQLTAQTGDAENRDGSHGDSDGEDIGLLAARHHDAKVNLDAKLHDLSVFKPSSHLFIGGDFNYRISLTSPPPDAVFPSPDPESPNYFEKFLPMDQLTRERKAGRTFHGMMEAPVAFPPTYKYKALPRVAPENQIETHVPATFARHRYPSWTDRILYLDTPPWVHDSSSSTNAKKQKQATSIDVHTYTSLPLMRSSDHQPVYLHVSVPLLSREVLAPPHGGSDMNHDSDDNDQVVGTNMPTAWQNDPRARLPSSIDADSWAVRRAGRRREWAVGWAGAVWATRQGALVLATVLSLVAATYVAVQNFYEFE